MDKKLTGEFFPVGSLVECIENLGPATRVGDILKVTETLMVSGRHAFTGIRQRDGWVDSYYSYRFKLSNPYTDGDWV